MANFNILERRLIAAARKDPPPSQVPLAFEKRIMARIGSSLPFSPWVLWCAPLWRAAISCVAITLLCGLWCLVCAPKTERSESFSQAFEGAVFSTVNDRFEDAR